MAPRPSAGWGLSPSCAELWRRQSFTDGFQAQPLALSRFHSTQLCASSALPRMGSHPIDTLPAGADTVVLCRQI